MRDQMVAAVKELMTELFFGAQHQYTWMVDNGADQGILGTVAAVSASDASRDPGTGKNSMVAHANHILFSLRMANAYMRGEKPNADWESSWAVQSLDDAGWQNLQADLKAAAEELLSNADKVPVEDQETVTSFIASIGHMGYHLGALRQLRP